MIRLIVGLGNPGSQYEKTRHNAGFIFLDGLAVELGVKWATSAQFQGEFVTAEFSGNKVILLKPMTFMNRSGASVGRVLRYFRLNCDELLVVHDELDLPAGAIRLKRDGGHAGHNGIRDIIAHVGSKDFYRLRAGIGRPEAGIAVSDYVLSNFTAQARNEIDNVFSSATELAAFLLSGDVAAFNGKISKLK